MWRCAPPLAPAPATCFDMNRDGIPDALQRLQSVCAVASQAPASYAPPHAVAPAPVMAVTGKDMNRDGVPDFLQQPATAGTYATPPGYGVTLTTTTGGHPFAPSAVTKPTPLMSTSPGYSVPTSFSTTPWYNAPSPGVVTTASYTAPPIQAGSVPPMAVPCFDFNRDGIPDQMLRTSAGYAQPIGYATTASYTSPLLCGMSPVMTVTGVDVNRDGIPDRAPMSYPLPLGSYTSPQQMFQQPMGSYTAPVSYNHAAPLMTVTGVDMNRDGIPDVLQQHQMNYPSPLSNYSAPVNYCAPPAGVMAVTGLDRNRDGIPDAMQLGPPVNYTTSVNYNSPMNYPNPGMQP